MKLLIIYLVDVTETKFYISETLWKFKIFIVSNAFKDFLCKVRNPINTGCEFNNCFDFRICSYFLLILCVTQDI